jgi:hypothetical protein
LSDDWHDTVRQVMYAHLEPGARVPCLEGPLGARSDGLTALDFRLIVNSALILSGNSEAVKRHYQVELNTGREREMKRWVEQAAHAFFVNLRTLIEREAAEVVA